jgi:hypothetical protein
MGLLPDPVAGLTRIANGAAGYTPTKKGVAEMATRSKAKAQKAEEVEELEDDDDVELEDLDEEVTEDEAPAKGGATEVTFGVSDLVTYLEKKFKVTTTPRELRALIRKMAREDKPRVDREIVPGNRARYDWPDGPKDPEVKRIIKAVVGGEMEADKKAKLAKLKEDKAAKAASKAKAEGKAKAKGSKKSKPAPEPEEDDEVEEVEFDDDED